MPATRLRAVTTVAALVLSLFFGVLAVRTEVNHTFIFREAPKLNLMAFRDGTIARPFVFRVLTPALMRLADPVVARVIDSGALPDWLGAKIQRVCAKATVRSPPQPCDLVISYCVVAAACAFGFFATMFFVFWQLRAGATLSLCGVLVSFLILNGIFLEGQGFVYDFTVLMFGAMLTLCLLSRRNGCYYALLLPAILTKESLILYIFSFLAINFRVMSRRQLIIHAVLQSAMFAVTYLTILFIFRNTGGPLVWLPALRLQFLAATDMNLSDVLLLLSAGIGLFYRFSAKDRGLKAMSVIIVPWFALFIIGGIGLRVTFEVLPVMILLVTDTIATLITGTPQLRTDDLSAVEVRGG